MIANIKNKTLYIKIENDRLLLQAPSYSQLVSREHGLETGSVILICGVLKKKNILSTCIKFKLSRVIYPRVSDSFTIFVSLLFAKVRWSFQLLRFVICKEGKPILFFRTKSTSSSASLKRVHLQLQV